jgi:hypothetical protein
VERAAYHKDGEKFGLKLQPAKAIIELGRNRFLIPLENIPEALRGKINTGSVGINPTHISHAELLKLTVLNSLENSHAGKEIIKKRSEALKKAGPVLTIPALSKLPNQQQIKQVKISEFKPITDAVANDIFGKAIGDSGLPIEIITIWEDFDKKLKTWAQGSLNLSEDALDDLRSALGFDLIVTRLIYPLCIGSGDAATSVYPIWFADSLRQSIEPLWKNWFAVFKNSQTATTLSRSSPALKVQQAEDTTNKSQ